MDEEEFDDFFSNLAASTVEPYLYEPEYTEEELEEREAAAAGAAAASAATSVDSAAPEPERRANSNAHCKCGRCPPMPTEKESLCCREWDRAQFILEDLPAAIEGTGPCMTTHRSFFAHIDSGVLETYFTIPKINWRRQPDPEGPGGTLSLR